MGVALATAPRWCAWGGAIEAAIDRPRLASFAAGHRGHERDSEPSLDKCLHRLDLRAAATDPRADLAPRAEAEHLFAKAVAFLHKDETFGLQIGGAQGAPGGEGMAGGQGDEQVFGEQRLRLEGSVVDR